MYKRCLLTCLLLFTFSHMIISQDRDYSSKLTETITSQYKNINCVIISRNKSILYEQYFNDYNSNTLFAQNSATKTITALAIGICIDNNYITNLTDTIDMYIDTGNIDNNEITIKNLLTMTDGKKYKESAKTLMSTSDLVSYFLDLPYEYRPGEKFRYSSLNSQVLSRIISNVTGMKEAEFVRKKIFNELKIVDTYWMEDSSGTTYGGLGLRLKATDMLKIGYLMLDNGKYQDKRIISENWIKAMTQIQNDGGGPSHEKYGYHCWITNVKGYSAYFAGGFGGQFIYIIPELKSVIIITSNCDKHREFHRDIIKDYIVDMLKEK